MSCLNYPSLRWILARYIDEYIFVISFFDLVIPFAVCIDIPLKDMNTTGWSSEAFLKKKNYIINFDLLMNIEFIFYLHTIKLRVNLPFDTPECYGLTGKVRLGLK